MIKRTQKQIIKKWTTGLNNPVVSVVCITYNHSKYIASAIDSFLLQDTSFPFEIIIHDDASTDNTQQIIKEYADKYPQIIKPILQTENKMSKGYNITIDFAVPEIRGKYIAFCEGDDYWTNTRKLQTAYDYMENHTGCTLVSHLTDMYNCTSKLKSRYNPSFLERGGIISSDEIIIKTSLIHTSSFFFRKSLITDNIDIFNRVHDYDSTYVMTAATEGYIYVIPRTMSLYRVETIGSWTYVSSNIDDVLVKTINEEIYAAKLINKYRNYNFDASFKEKIRRQKFDIYKYTRNYKSLCKYKDLYAKMGISDHIIALLRYFPDPVRRLIHNWVRPVLLNIYYRINRSKGYSDYKK